LHTCCSIACTGTVLLFCWWQDSGECRSECEDGRQRTSWLIGLTKTTPANGVGNKRIDIRSTIQDFKQKCEAWGGHTAGMTLEIKHLKFDSLPEYLAVHGRQAAPLPVLPEGGDDYQIPAVHAGTADQTGTPKSDKAESRVPDTASNAQAADAQPASDTGGHMENQGEPETALRAEGESPAEPEKFASPDVTARPLTEVNQTPDTASDRRASSGNAGGSPVGSKRKRDEPAPERDGAQRLHSQQVAV
jgi:hypothetical protein